MNPLPPVIDVHAAAALGDRVLFVDCRFDLAAPDAGETAYRQAHLPGAVYAHLGRDLSDHASAVPHAGRHPLPTAAQLAARLSSWGWAPGMPVVAYDAAAGALAAARLWWLLRLAGIAEVAVLDGGIGAWQAAGLPLDDTLPTRAPTSVSLSFDETQLVTADALQQALADNAAVLLDARARPRYLGEIEPIDPVAGHVPGAGNRPFGDNLTAEGRFRSPAELREAFAGLMGDAPASAVVHMCGSGVTACHNALAMAVAGLPGSRLYAPSWSGWISDRARPVATG
jgi:thiosulfate/3-mercaptopyruvate sulfurtransferase